MKIGFSPAAGLVGVHSALVTGTHGFGTKIAKWDEDNSAVTRFAAIQAIEGEFEANWTRPANLRYMEHSVAANDYLNVSIQIPHGAIVTEAWAIMEVEDSGDALAMYLYRKRNDTGAEDIMATKASIADTGIQKSIDTTINNATIDNENYTYTFQFETYTGLVRYGRVYSMGVKYTIVRPYA